MKRLAYFYFTFFLVSLLFVAPFAKAQGTYTAASCNLSDVNAVINGPLHTAVNGDTIKIPAGSCTWTGSNGIIVPAGIGISIVGNGTPNNLPSQKGAGTVNTTITDNLSSGSLFNFTPKYGASLTRLSSLHLLPTVPNPGYGAPIGVQGTCTSSGCPNIRIDNIIAPSSWAGNRISDDTFADIANVFGVLDHNTIGDTQPSSNGVVLANVGHGNWLGVGNWGDNSWASPDTFGTAQALYLENNVFNYAVGTDTDTFASYGGGGRFVCRFNTFNSISSGGACTMHGTDTTGRLRGGRQWEAYYNTGTCSSSTIGCASAWPGRSGVGRSFANSFSNVGSGFMTGLANLDAQRRWRPDTPWGACDGSSPWDVNDGVVYYTGTIGSVSGANTGVWTITDSGTPNWTTNQWSPNGAPYSYHNVTLGNSSFSIDSNTSNGFSSQYMCQSCAATPATGNTYQIMRATVCLDQPARGAGLLVTGNVDGFNPVLASTGKPGSVNQALDPTYEADDVLPSTANGKNTIGGSRAIIANRDFYAESVNQAAQTGPTSPFNGTSGSGHGTLANRPATCTKGVGYWATDQGSWNTSGIGGQGVLYICISTNTWTLSYTPFTYPHALIAGGTTGTGGNSPSPPTNLAATVQ